MFDLKEPKRLGDGCNCPHCEWLRKTCDRIEALERENAAMAKVVGAVRRMCDADKNHDCMASGNAWIDCQEALAALAPAMSKEPT